VSEQSDTVENYDTYFGPKNKEELEDDPEINPDNIVCTHSFAIGRDG
jgi:hypothetical protein